MVDSSISLSHVAFVVPTAEKAAEAFSKQGLEVQAPDVFEGEGTKEIYVGDYKTHRALPLLMEPINKTGSYARALQKRGPGLHHIAVDVLNLEKYIDKLVGSGWFLHLNSLHTIRHMKTAYLARPGMPTMIEVQERESLSSKPLLIQELHLNLDQKQMAMIQALGLTQVHSSAELAFTINSKKTFFKELI